MHSSASVVVIHPLFNTHVYLNIKCFVKVQVLFQIFFILILIIYKVSFRDRKCVLDSKVGQAAF